MTRDYTYFGLFAALALSACSSTPYTSPYGSTPIAANQAPATIQYANSTYSAASASSYSEDCKRKETNRQLIGGALGGTAGAFAGKELIGGTKGTLVGAALGGAAGYGIGDISVDCSPAQSNATYQSAPAASYQGNAYQQGQYQQGAQTYGATPASYQSVSCPAGTTTQANGTCLLADSSSLEASSNGIGQTSSSPYQVYQAPAPAPAPVTQYQAAPAPAPRTSPYTQYIAPAAPAQSVVTANTSIAPSPYSGTVVTRQLGGSNYQVQQGDTVYSLSRKLCVPLSEIQRPNGLDAGYGIKIGQGLNLPASRC